VVEVELHLANGLPSLTIVGTNKPKPPRAIPASSAK